MTNSTSRRSGFTLVELAIATLVLSLMLAGLGLFQARQRGAVQASTSIALAQQQAQRAMETVLRELDGAAIARFVPDPTGSLGSSDFVFQKPAGVAADGTIQWANPERLLLEPDAGEILNGVDDDHDGLVDECQLTLVRDAGMPSERRVVLVHGLPALLPGELANGLDDDADGVVDARGFSVQRIGSLLQIALAVEARNGGGPWTAWTERASLRLRN